MPRDDRGGRRPPEGGRSGRARRPEGSGRSASSRREGRGRRAPVRVDTFHNDPASEPISRRTVFTGVLAVGMLAGVGALLDYQVVNGETYRQRADERRISSQTLFARRGTIYDRNGNVLTSSVECQNVYANPRLVEDVDKAVKALVELLGLDADACREKLERDTTFVYLKRQVNQDVADELADRDIAGIEFEQTIKRVYPYGTLASQVLGVVNMDNQGVSGLEKYYDDVLQGENGSLVRERARDGSFIAGGAYEKVEAIDGTDLILTLDADIQKAAEDALAEAVETSLAHYGSIIVTDPRTGEILACCSSPTFDPTDLANTASEDMNLRAVTDSYEPGSVFKALVCGMAIDAGLVTPETEFDVPAGVKVGDYTVGDVDDRDYAMTMTVREIMRRSSNTGMVLVGRKIGVDRFAEYLTKYGIDEASGIDFPGESPGTIRSRDEYDGSSLGSMSFGQGIAVAPVRVMRAMSAISNGGVTTVPHFLQSKGGETVDWTEGDREVISADAAADVASMMVTVVDEGSGQGGQVEGYDVAGKTGTAQRASESGGYEANAFMASFMGFAPASDPRVQVYVTLDGTPNSSAAAARPFARVMREALTVLGIPRTR